MNKFAFPFKIVSQMYRFAIMIEAVAMCIDDVAKDIQGRSKSEIYAG